jgi:2-oxoacid:acceptor oxidoreductase delta subunit (pyruvate/2-ketoisovalerate family)
MLSAQGSFKEAWEMILWENPFPGVCGRVCPHPCEEVCNRKEFDEAIAIHALERFLAETAGRYDLKPVLTRLAAKKRRIAIVGAGPAGLSAAYFLSLLGYSCDVLEAMSEPGGVLRWGIPVYRLPVQALRSDIANIESQDVRILTGQRIGSEFWRGAEQRYDAVFMGCGHSRTLKLGVPGEETNAIEDGLRFLEQLRQGDKISLRGVSAVIGGGNTAIDVARSIIRCGGKAVILYRRRRYDMPAFEEEVQMGIEEGVELRELVTLAGITADGAQYTLSLQEMKISGEDSRGRANVLPDEGKIRELRVERVFKAIGAEPAEDWFSPPYNAKMSLTLSHTLLVSPESGPALVFGGDLTTEIKSVAHAVASGKQAAMALDIFFHSGIEDIVPKLAACRVGQGPSLSIEMYMGGNRRLRNTHVVSYEEINTDHFQFQPRITRPRLLKEERRTSFKEIDLKISTNLAIREAERCFNCGICNQCDNCYMFCPDVAVIREKNDNERHINYDYCKGCGLCVVECPRNAMTLREEDV